MSPPEMREQQTACEEPARPQDAAAETAGPPASAEEVGSQAAAWRWIRWAATLTTLFVGYQLLLVVRGWAVAVLTVVLYFIFGATMALLLGPFMNLLMTRLRLPRTLAALLVVLVVLGLLVTGASLAADRAVAEVRGLVADAPRWISQAQGLLNGVNASFAGRSVSLGGSVNGMIAGLASSLPQALLTGVAGVVGLAADVVVVLVVTFWLLRDGPELRAGFESWMPVRIRPEVSFALDAVQVVVGGYVRAQLVMALLIGTLAGAGSFLLGVPFPLVVALAAGVFELIPIVGPFAGGAVAVALALTRSPILALYTALYFLGIHVLEGYILAPRIQARFVQLHPVMAFLALFAGIEVGGFMGAFMAVPVASLGAVFLRAAIGDWKASRPDLFAMARDPGPGLERRRRRLLGQFKVLRRPRPG